MEPRKPAPTATPGRAYANTIKTARSPAVAPSRPDVGAPRPPAMPSNGVVLPMINPASTTTATSARTTSPSSTISKRTGWTTPRNPGDVVASPPVAARPPGRTARILDSGGEFRDSASPSGSNISFWNDGALAGSSSSSLTAEDTDQDEATQLAYMDNMYTRIQALNAELDRDQDKRALSVEHHVEQRERAALESMHRYGSHAVEESENFGVVGAQVPLQGAYETNAETVNRKFRPHQPRSTSPPQPAALLPKDQLELCAALGKNAELRIRSREIERQAEQASSVIEQNQRQIKMAERRIANREEKLRALLKEKLHWQSEMKDLREQVVEEKMRQVDLMRRLETNKRETTAQLDQMQQALRDTEDDNHALRSYLIETKSQLAMQTKRLDDCVKQARDEKERLTECIMEARGKFRVWKEGEALALKAQRDQALNHQKAEYELKIARHQDEKQKLREKVKDLEVSVRLMQKDRSLSPLELSLRKATILGSKDHAGTTEAELIEAHVRIKELEALLEHSQDFQKRQENIIKVSETTISRLIQEREVAALDNMANQQVAGSPAWTNSSLYSDLSPLSVGSHSSSGPGSAMSSSSWQATAPARATYKSPSAKNLSDAPSPRVDPSPPPGRPKAPENPFRQAVPSPRASAVLSPSRKNSRDRLVNATESQPLGPPLIFSSAVSSDESTSMKNGNFAQEMEEMQPPYKETAVPVQIEKEEEKREPAEAEEYKSGRSCEANEPTEDADNRGSSEPTATPHNASEEAATQQLNQVNDQDATTCQDHSDPDADMIEAGVKGHADEQEQVSATSELVSSTVVADDGTETGGVTCPDDLVDEPSDVPSDAVSQLHESISPGSLMHEASDPDTPEPGVSHDNRDETRDDCDATTSKVSNSFTESKSEGYVAEEKASAVDDEAKRDSQNQDEEEKHHDNEPIADESKNSAVEPCESVGSQECLSPRNEDRVEDSLPEHKSAEDSEAIEPAVVATLAEMVEAAAVIESDSTHDKPEATDSANDPVIESESSISTDSGVVDACDEPVHPDEDSTPEFDEATLVRVASKALITSVEREALDKVTAGLMAERSSASLDAAFICDDDFSAEATPPTAAQTASEIVATRLVDQVVRDAISRVVDRDPENLLDVENPDAHVVAELVLSASLSDAASDSADATPEAEVVQAECIDPPTSSTSTQELSDQSADNEDWTLSNDISADEAEIQALTIVSPAEDSPMIEIRDQEQASATSVSDQLGSATTSDDGSMAVALAVAEHTDATHAPLVTRVMATSVVVVATAQAVGMIAATSALRALTASTTAMQASLSERTDSASDTSIGSNLTECQAFEELSADDMTAVDVTESVDDACQRSSSADDAATKWPSGVDVVSQDDIDINSTEVFIALAAGAEAPDRSADEVITSALLTSDQVAGDLVVAASSEQEQHAEQDKAELHDLGAAQTQPEDGSLDMDSNSSGECDMAIPTIDQEPPTPMHEEDDVVLAVGPVTDARGAQPSALIENCYTLHVTDAEGAVAVTSSAVAIAAAAFVAEVEESGLQRVAASLKQHLRPVEVERNGDAAECGTRPSAEDDVAAEMDLPPATTNEDLETTATDEAEAETDVPYQSDADTSTPRDKTDAQEALPITVSSTTTSASAGVEPESVSWDDLEAAARKDDENRGGELNSETQPRTVETTQLLDVGDTTDCDKTEYTVPVAAEGQKLDQALPSIPAPAPATPAEDVVLDCESKPCDPPAPVVAPSLTTTAPQLVSSLESEAVEDCVREIVGAVEAAKPTEECEQVVQFLISVESPQARAIEECEPRTDVETPTTDDSPLLTEHPAPANLPGADCGDPAVLAGDADPTVDIATPSTANDSNDPQGGESTITLAVQPPKSSVQLINRATAVPDDHESLQEPSETKAIAAEAEATEPLQACDVYEAVAGLVGSVESPNDPCSLPLSKEEIPDDAANQPIDRPVQIKSKTDSWQDLVSPIPFHPVPSYAGRASVPLAKSPAPDHSRYQSAIVRELIRDPTLMAYDVTHEQSQPFAMLDETILMIDQNAQHMQHDENDKARRPTNDGVKSKTTVAIEGVLVTKRKKMESEARRKSIAYRIIPAFNYEPVLIKFQWSDFVVATPIRLMSSASQLNLLHSLNGGGGGAAASESQNGGTRKSVVSTAGAIPATEQAATSEQQHPQLQSQQPQQQQRPVLQIQILTSPIQKMKLILKKGVKLVCGTYVIISVFNRPLEDGNENLRIQIYDPESLEEFQYDFHEDHLREYVEVWKGGDEEARAFYERLEFRREQGSIIIKMPDKIRNSTRNTPALDSADDANGSATSSEGCDPRVFTPTPMSQLLTNLATTQPLELPPEPQYRLSPNAPVSASHEEWPRLESLPFIPRIQEDSESMASSVALRSTPGH